MAEVIVRSMLRNAFATHSLKLRTQPSYLGISKQKTNPDNTRTGSGQKCLPGFRQCLADLEQPFFRRRIMPRKFAVVIGAAQGRQVSF
jgi:hypothetical protein